MVDAELIHGYLGAQWATGDTKLPVAVEKIERRPLQAVHGAGSFGLRGMGAAPAEVTVNTNDETATGAQTLSSSGFEHLLLSDGDSSVKVTVGSMDRWDRSHLRRLRQSADLPGLVPVIDSDLSSDDKPFAVTPSVDHPNLADRIPPEASQWPECAAIVEASARALHEAHLRGLFHGSLSPNQIYVINEDIAVEGVGLGLGGVVQADYQHWAAPEVLDGADATERSDVYSLGKILEAALGNNIEDVPRSVRRLIMWSSSDTPEARPPSALEFASILAEALGDERRIYSPAFIPTADVNALAATASAEVAAHDISAPVASSGGAGVVAAAGVAATGAVVADKFLDDEPEIDDPSAGLEVVDDVDEAASEVDVDEADLVADDDTDADISDEDDLDTEAVDESVADSDANIDVEKEAVITDEIPESEIGGDAATTTELEGDLASAEDSSSFDSRDYTAATTTADTYEVPAAQTVEIVSPQEPSKRSNRAGILVGIIGALGLALIFWQLFNGDSAEETDVAANPVAEEEAVEAEEEAEASVSSDDSAPEAPTATEDEVAEEEAAVEEEPVAEEEAAEEEAEATEEAAEEAEAATEEPVEPAEAATTLLDGPIPASDAGIQIVHGIPGATVDVYVDGQALTPGFAPGTIAGPVDLAPGDYEVEIFAVSDVAPAASADRDDQPLLSQTVTVGDSAASLYAHLGEQGAPALSAFAEDFSTLAPGQGRAVARHLAAAPEVTLLVDGEPVGDLANGDTLAADLPAGSHDFSVQAGDAEVLAATLDIADGEVVVVSVTGSAADGTLAPVVQRYSGLSSAPTEVPTGDSNLLGMDEDMTNLYIVGIVTLAMALGGLALMTRRRRVL